MTSVVNTKFAVKPVAAALALAVSAGTAWAAPTPNQMPGAGQLVAVSLGSAGTSETGAVIGAPIINLTSGSGIGIDGKVVLRFGGAGAPTDPSNPAGFNLGANATLLFGAISPNSAVLNIDASGNPSQIFGNLISTAKAIPAVGSTLGCATCAFAPSIFIANANGIVVGAGARIVVPPTANSTLGLIGADMTGLNSIAEFVADNGWVAPNPQTLGTSYLSIPAYSANGNIEIGGAINGDLVTNTPANFIFVAGNNVSVLNTGNLFATRTTIDAGMLATATVQSVRGLTGQTVNRLFNVDTGFEAAFGVAGPLPGDLSIDTTAGVTGNVVNLGSVSAATAPTSFVSIQAKGNIRSGTLGDPNVTVGIFADAGILIDSYGAATPGANHVELYGVVSGYTTNKTLPSLYVNYYASFSPAVAALPNVTINAIKPGAQPSTITTTGPVAIWGNNVALNSTINHTNAANGGAQTDVDLFVAATGMLSVTADIGAGQDVILNSNGTTTISGNVLADTNSGGVGGIYIYNGAAGATTTISGNLTVPTTSTDTIYVGVNGPLTISGTVNGNGFVDVHNYGAGAGNSTTISGNVNAGSGIHVAQFLSPVAVPLTISGNMTTASGSIAVGNYSNALGSTTTISGNLTSNGGGVYVAHYGGIIGNLTITGTLSATTDVGIFSQGNAQVRNVVANESIFATVLGTSLLVDGPWTAGYDINITGTLATTALKPAAVLTAPSVNLNGLNFRGVNAMGNPYASIGQKPAQQIVTNNLNVMITGSINAPIAGNSNWPLNSLDVAPLFTLAPVFVTLSAVGGGFQAANIKVLGDAFFNTGATTTPYIGVPLNTGGFPSGGLQGNLGSSLIFGSTGFLKVIGAPTGSLIGPAVAAQWPGATVLFAGTTLELLTPFYNAYTTASPPFNGFFASAPFIALNGYIATSGTAWANFSTQPVTGNPTVYQIRQLGPLNFGFEATEAFVKNDYFVTITGVPPCTVTGPTTWTACP